MCHLRTWFSGGLGSVRLIVGLNDLKGIFQPKLFYNSLKKHNNYEKEEIEEGEAQDVGRSCKGAKGLMVRIRTCACYVICRKGWCSK